MKDPQPEVEIHSEEINDIISSVPGWINRWGITLIFIFFTITLFLSWFIKYPDIIRAGVTITATPLPRTLVTRTAGNIRLKRSETERIAAGEIVGYIRSNTDPENVISLEKLLYDAATPDNQFKGWDVGELQPLLTEFLNALNSYSTFRQTNTHSLQITQLLKQEENYRKLGKTLQAQLELNKEELHFAHEKFSRDSLLYRQGVISAQDYNTSQSAYLQQRRLSKNLETSIASNDIEMSAVRKQIIEYNADKVERDLTFSLNISNAKKELMAGILKWKETYLLTAPLSGTVSYMKFLENDLFVDAGEPLFTIIPDSKLIYAQARIPINGSGKVKAGQDVNIKLANYPFEQFGMLRGRITEVSELPSQENYHARITVGNDLTTTYNKTIPFRHELQGETEIITEDLRILERVFYQFKSLAR